MSFIFKFYLAAALPDRYCNAMVQFRRISLHSILLIEVIIVFTQ
mgnify:CR=1 FL=1